MSENNIETDISVPKTHDKIDAQGYLWMSLGGNIEYTSTHLAAFPGMHPTERGAAHGMVVPVAEDRFDITPHHKGHAAETIRKVAFHRFMEAQAQPHVADPHYDRVTAARKSTEAFQNEQMATRLRNKYFLEAKQDMMMTIQSAQTEPAEILHPLAHYQLQGRGFTAPSATTAVQPSVVIISTTPVEPSKP